MVARRARYRVTRRRILELGAGVAATVLLPTNISEAAPPPSAPSGVRHSYVSRVITVGGGRLEAEALTTHQRLSAPIVGFPPGVTPRAGDLVTITDSHPEYPIAALPVCRWHEGRPTSLTSGAIEIAGVAASGSALFPAAVRNQTVRACLLDTTLRDHQVLAIRGVA